MPDATRADLELAANRFFQELEQELDQRKLNIDNIAAELDFNREESRRRISELDDQLASNLFDKSVQTKAAWLIEGLANLDGMEPAMRIFSFQLAARAEREHLRKLIHLLNSPIQPYFPEDPVFTRTASATPVPMQALPVPPSGITFSNAAQAYIARIKAKKLSASHQNELARALRWLEECIGHDRQLTSITKTELRTFRDDIERLGANLQGSMLAFKDRFATSPTGRIKSVTAKRYWQSVKSFFAWAADEGHIEESPAASLKIQSVKGEVPRTPEAFSTKELRLLLASPLYAGYLSRKRVGTLGSCRIREGHWWSGILLLYTGMRASEFSQLLPSDFIFDHDIPHLKVQAEDGAGAKVKSAKSAASLRDVPLHPDLLRLGLRQLVERRAKLNPKGRTFHEFNLGVHGRKSDGMTKFWSLYLKRTGLWKPSRSTHVFRHTLAACLRANGATDEEIGGILGHSPQSVTAGYGGAIPLSRKLKTLGALDFGFDVVNGLGGDYVESPHRA